MTDNPLVAEPEATDPLAGTFLLYDGWHLCDDLAHGSWTAVLDLVAVALDTAATVSDPLGSLVAAGLGWLMDHVEPLKGWLEDLAGDPGAVKGYAETWHNIAESLRSDAETFGSQLDGDLGAMSGDAVRAYRGFAAHLDEVLEGAAEAADSTGTAMTVMGTIVDAVHGTVRDVLAQVVGALISYAAELVCTLGLATPLVIEQASTRVADAVAEVGGKVKAVVEASDGLKAALKNVDHFLDDVRGVLDKLQPGVAKGEHRAPTEAPRHSSGVPSHDPTPTGGRHAAPPESPGAHVKDPGEVLRDRLKDIGKRDDWQDGVAETSAAGASTGRPHEE